MKRWRRKRRKQTTTNSLTTALLCGLVVAGWAVVSCDRRTVSTKVSAVRTVRVARVIDGDTVSLDDGRIVRYLGLDTPERGEPGYVEAREANRNAVEGTRVVLETVGRSSDAHGRLLAMVRVSGPDPLEDRCVNLELVRGGYGWVYQKYGGLLPDDFVDDLVNAQRVALERQAGVWARIEEYEKRSSELVSTRFRIHRSGCRHVRQGRPRKVRSLLGELRQGKSPCRTCRPVW